MKSTNIIITTIALVLLSAIARSSSASYILTAANPGEGDARDGNLPSDTRCRIVNESCGGPNDFYCCGSLECNSSLGKCRQQPNCRESGEYCHEMAACCYPYYCSYTTSRCLRRRQALFDATTTELVRE